MNVTLPQGWPSQRYVQERAGGACKGALILLNSLCSHRGSPIQLREPLCHR